MTKSEIRKMVREIVDDCVDETTNSAGIDGYAVPMGFTGKKSTNKKTNSMLTRMGWTVVDGDRDGNPEDLDKEDDTCECGDTLSESVDSNIKDIEVSLRIIRDEIRKIEKKVVHVKNKKIGSPTIRTRKSLNDIIERVNKILIYFNEIKN